MSHAPLPFKEVQIDASRITDWPSFHSVFAEACGFPSFYGRNMNAWIDCMTSLDDPDAAMSEVHSPPGGIVVLTLLDAKAFAARCPDQYNALNECSAFVNARRLETGDGPVLALSYHE
jgi:RNAse (barnase) inhibitor barstar